MRLIPLLTAALLLVFATGVAAQPRILASPATVLEGQPIRVRLEGLPAGQTVTLYASRLWDRYPEGQEPYRGRASFLVGADGTLDLGVAPPLAGSDYEAADPAGLFWSMSPLRRDSPPVPGGVRTAEAIAGLGPGEVTLEAVVKDQVVARATVRLQTQPDGVSLREIRTQDLTGVFATGAGGKKRPAIILLGGSEGGLFTARGLAPLLAAEGYAVFGLGYIRGDEPALTGLSPNLERIPIELIAAARDWLAKQPGVDAERIALVGVSTGGQLALVAGSIFPWVDAIAAFAPSEVVWEGIPPAEGATRAMGSTWTLGGDDLPFVRWSVTAEQRGDRAREASGSSRLTEVHLEALAEYAADVPAATIRVENSRAALFLVAGIDDGMWPSARSVERIQARLKAAGYGRPVEVMLLPTGHQVLGTGWGPTTTFQRATGRLQGGNARLDAAAQAQAWPRLLDFLARELGAEQD